MAKRPYDADTHGAAIRRSIETSREAVEKELGKGGGYVAGLWNAYPREANAILKEMVAAGNALAIAKAKMMKGARTAAKKRKNAVGSKKSAPVKKALAKKQAAKKSSAKPLVRSAATAVPSAAPVESRTLIVRIQQLEAQVLKISHALGV